MGDSVSYLGKIKPYILKLYIEWQTCASAINRKVNGQHAITKETCARTA